jgi:hypothetical protein
MAFPHHSQDRSHCVHFSAHRDIEEEDFKHFTWLVLLGNTFCGKSKEFDGKELKSVTN